MYKINLFYYGICNSLVILKRQKNIQQFARIFAGCIIAFALFSCSTVKELPSPSTPEEESLPTTVEDKPVVPVEPAVEKGPLEVLIVVEDYYTGLYHYSVEYPTFVQYPELTRHIEGAVQKHFTEFEELAVANYQAQIDTMSREERSANEKSGKPLFSFFVRWEYGELSQDFISIKVETYQYAGGANGMTFIDTFNWYPDENRFFTIEDIPAFMGIHYTKSIWLDYLSNNSRSRLENKINRDENPVISDMINDGTAPQVKNFERFTIQGSNITLWFQEYQVAAGSFGILSITLPMEN